EPFETPNPWATDGRATVMRVPSSWSSAAAAVQAASLLHAPGGCGSRTRLGLSVRERRIPDTTNHYGQGRNLGGVFAGMHLAEFLPPAIATVVYLYLYCKRVSTLAREGRPVSSWRIASFVSGVALLAAVQIGPLDTLADQMLVFHMAQHLVIGDFCSLLVVLGITGPVIQPLLHFRPTRPLRKLAHPLVALVLWATNLYAWHLPIFYVAAIRFDLIHALEHASFFWFGSLLWLALIGPLPKPKWFKSWGALGYIIAVRFAGALLGNILIWASTVFYGTYKLTDPGHAISPLSDQNLAGGLMMIEEMVLTTVLLGWLFYRFAIQDEERQQLLDLAADRGIELSE